MSLLERIAKWFGKLFMREELMAGIMASMDFQMMARVINRNASQIADMVGYLDTSVLAEVINKNPDLIGELISNLDPKALSQAMNKNQRLIIGMLDEMDPSIIPRISNVMMAKIRSTSSRPRPRPVVEDQTF